MRLRGELALAGRRLPTPVAVPVTVRPAPLLPETPDPTSMPAARVRRRAERRPGTAGRSTA
jgi:hypothetical protein